MVRSPDQLPFELGQCREDAEHEAAGRRGGVDMRALTGEHPQAHAAGRQILHGVDQMGARLRPRRSSFQTRCRSSDWEPSAFDTRA